jgi:hypothetical protein
MKSFAAFSLAIGLSIAGASAKTHQFPSDEPLGQVDISKDWKVEETKNGDLKLSHKTGDIFVGVMTVDANKAGDVAKTLIESIAKEGMSYDESTIKKQEDITLGHFKHVSEMTAVAHKGKPYHVVLDFVPLSDKKIGVVFLLGEDADVKANAKDLDELAASFDVASAEDDDDDE